RLDRSVAARRVDPPDHLRVFRVAGQEPERAGLGRGVRADHVRARDEPVRPDRSRAAASEAQRRRLIVTTPSPRCHKVAARDGVSGRQPAFGTCSNPRTRRNSMKRTGFALLLTAAVSLLAVSAAGAKHTATVINGAGSTFVSPLVSVWTPALGSAFD